MRIGPARDIARGIDSGHAGLQIAIDDNATVHRKPRLLRKCQPWPDADAGNNQIGRDYLAAFEHDAALIELTHPLLEMEDHAMLFVKGAHELSHLGAEHSFHRYFFGANDMHLDFTCLL